MAVGDKVQDPKYGGYATHEITNDTVGQLEAAALVKIVDDSGASASPATAANQATEIASLSVMDDWDESDRAKVNVIVGQAGITAGAGAVAANTPRVTHASDDPAITLLTAVSAKLTGAANIAIGQATAGSASGVLVASRATRRTVVVRNTDAAATAYIGTGTVTSGNGFPLRKGESIALDTTAGLNCIRDSTDVVLAYVEIYD